MRVASEDVRRNILREIPGARAVTEIEIHRRHVAGMIPVARAHHHGHHIARLHGEIFERTKLHFLRSLRYASGEPLPRTAAAQFHRPSHAIAALGMRVLHHALDAQRRRDRTAPTDDDAPIRRGMHGDAVRLHVAGNAHMLVGRVRQNAQGIRARPALDKIVALRALHLRRHVRIDARFARSDAEAFQPRCENRRFDAVLLRQLRHRVLVRRTSDLRCRCETLGRAGENLFSMRR